MATIYRINGGGQFVQQSVQKSTQIQYEKVENSDWPEKCKCDGQDLYANTMWSTDLGTLQLWANNWAGCEVDLIEHKPTNE